MPAEEEFNQYQQLIEVTSSPKKALRLVSKWYNHDELEQAAAMRKEDLLVYFALALFQKHKGYAQQPESLKRDIKAFFGNYNVALTQAKELLFSIADTEIIEKACIEIAEKVNGKLIYEDEIPHSLIIEKSSLNNLPAILRVYVGSALQLYGDIDEVHEIKIHINSGKVSLLTYFDWGKADTLTLRERVKINMSNQRITIFNNSNEFRN